MAPDAIYDYALLETSRWQREAMIDLEALCKAACDEGSTVEEWDAAAYASGFLRPNYPVPSVIGEVLYLWTGAIFEIHIEDADDRFNLRLWYGVSALSGKLYDDRVFHNSPNRR